MLIVFFSFSVIFSCLLSYHHTQFFFFPIYAQSVGLCFFNFKTSVETQQSCFVLCRFSFILFKLWNEGELLLLLSLLIWWWCAGLFILLFIPLLGCLAVGLLRSIRENKKNMTIERLHADRKRSDRLQIVLFATWHDVSLPHTTGSYNTLLSLLIRPRGATVIGPTQTISS